MNIFFRILTKHKISFSKSRCKFHLSNGVLKEAIIGILAIVWMCFSISSTLYAQSGSLLVDRGLPTTLINLGKPGENPDRSNIRWFNARPSNSGDTVDVGDDFSIGSAGEHYLINSIKVWVVTLGTQDPNPNSPDLRNSHPTLGLIVGAASAGFSGLQTILSGAAGSTNINYKQVQYINGQNFWTLPSARDDPIWEVVFDNLNWTVEGGTSYQFFVTGDRVLQTNGTVQIGVPLHASNAARSGSPQEGSDGLFRLARFVNGTPVEVGRINSDPAAAAADYPSGGWNKSSDINIQVYGDKLASVAGTVKSRGGTVVDGATVTLGSMTATSSINGVYRIFDVPPGTYSLDGSKNSISFVPKGFANPLSVASENLTGKDLVEDYFLVKGGFSCDPVGGITVTSDGFATKSKFGAGFSLAGLKSGTHTLTAKYPGMNISPVSINIEGSDISGVVFKVSPASVDDPIVSTNAGTVSVKMQTFSELPNIFLVDIQSRSGGSGTMFLSNDSPGIAHLAPGLYKVRYQVGVGESGKRIATKYSKWVNFAVAAPSRAAAQKGAKPVSQTKAQKARIKARMLNAK